MRKDRRVDLFWNTIDYIKENYNQGLLSRIKEKCLCYDKIVIFGAGEIGHKVYNRISENDIEISVFADNYLCSQIDKRTELPIISIEELKEKYSKALILISAFFDSVSREIENQLLGEGFLEEQLMSVGKLGKFLEISFLMEHVSDYYKVYSLLEDELSKKVYLEKLKFMYLENDLSEIADISGNIYFNDCIHLGKNEVFVDCGGYDGDTSKEFINFVNGKYKSIVIFEPEKNKENSIRNNLQGFDYELYMQGVWSSNTVLRFDGNKGAGSHISDNGIDSVYVVALDQEVKKYNPTYIKMDIEGAEKEVLIGCKEIIREAAPKLAVSIYHKPEDLYELPLLIKELNPNYKLIIRHHSNDWYDTVCYAIL